MELDIDFSVAARYGEIYDFYCRNLKVFKSFCAVFDSFFKKEKYQNAEIKIESDAKHKATIVFCGKKYRLRLAIDPTDLNSALIVLLKMDKEGRKLLIAQATIADAESVFFAKNTRIFLKDKYEFNNAVLNFFIAGITGRLGKERAAG